MSYKVAFPFRHHAALVCDEARQMLLTAGCELITNDTGRKLTREEQKAMIADADAIVAGTEVYDEDMLSVCTHLSSLIRFGVGTDNFDLVTLRKMGVCVGVIANHTAVAEFALTLILSVMKNLPRYDEEVRKAGWGRYPMRELSGKTVGIVGFGRIGRHLAELLSGFRVKLLVYDPYLNEKTAAELNAIPVSFEELLAESDVVSLHLPSTPETYHIINSENLAKMKDGAYLVNTSRGVLVDECALSEALKNGKLAGASIDVYEKEPITAENPLIGLSNTTLSPHVSALTYETNYNGGIICAQSILSVREGGKPVYPLW